MKKVYILIGLVVVLLLLALLAVAFGPQFELRGLPPDIRDFQMNSTDIHGKWRMLGGLIAFVALLFGLLAGILWFHEKRAGS